MELTLQLDAEDAAFLAGIHAWLSINPDPTLDEDQLRNIYRIVSEVAHGDPSSVMQRATSAIARLREQRLMVRTDTAGIARGGDTRCGTVSRPYHQPDRRSPQSVGHLHNRCQPQVETCGRSSGTVRRPYHNGAIGYVISWRLLTTIS